MCRDGGSGVLGLGFRDYGLGFGVSELHGKGHFTRNPVSDVPKNL